MTDALWSHETLMALTEHLPMKRIDVQGEPYLERYYVCTLPDGTQTWLHRFLRRDSERHLHTHPWSALSTVLVGEYMEERQHGELRHYAVGARNVINPDTLHRIVSVTPNTWTCLQVAPERAPEWGFVGEDGTYTPVRASRPDWHRMCLTRAQQE